MSKIQVVVNITDYSRQLRFNNQLFLWLDPSETILSVKKTVILEGQKMGWIFSKDFHKCLECVSVNNGQNHSSPNDKVKLQKFNTTNNTLYLDMRFPQRLICLELHPQNKKFCFDNTMSILKCMNFIKNETGLNYKNFSFNGNPIKTDTVDMDRFFNSNQLNIIETEIKPNINEQKSSESSENLEFGTIYLIRTREFKNINKNIFKIGKTGNDISKRLGSYGKGGQVFFSIAVKISELDSVERDLIEIFSKKFSQRTEIGTEYFEGNFKDMINNIYTICLSKL